MSQPSSQGPCICPEGAVKYTCPRHAFMQDWVGQHPFKDHLREYEFRDWGEALERHIAHNGGLTIGDTFMVGGIAYQVEAHDSFGRFHINRVSS